MTLETWLAFTAATIVLLVIPGPTILTVISYSITHGRRANLPLVVAVALGDSTALFLSLAGLGAVLATSALLFTLVKWAGGIYLIYLGVRMLRGRTTVVADAEETAPVLASRWKLFVNTYTVTALASARAQRRFNRVGGCLLAGAGVWALLARRTAVTV